MLNPALNTSIPNNFYNSGMAGSQLNGTGSTIQTNKLNLQRNAPGVVVTPGPVQIVEQPVEVVKTVKRTIPAPAIAPTRTLQQLDPNLRNLIAETHAKVCLLVMENNRIRWRIAQKDAEIARARGGVVGGPVMGSTFPQGVSTAPGFSTLPGTAGVVRGPYTTTPGVATYSPAGVSSFPAGQTTYVR